MTHEPMAPRQPVSTLAPAARLAASHEALAHYLRGGAAPRADSEDTSGAAGTSGREGAEGTATAAPRIHANLAGVLARNALAPLARDHPWALVGAAAVAGALIAAGPWRLFLRPLMVAGMVSPILTRWATRALVNNLAHRLLGPDLDRTR